MSFNRQQTHTFEQTNFKAPERDDLQIDNLPNRITIFRILLIPLVITFLYLSQSDYNIEQELKVNFGWAAGWIFALASITDFFDGYIARKRNIVTVFGSFLDPIADKFLTVSSLIMLGCLGKISVFIVIILILREMYMTSLRLLANNEGVTVPVNIWGKAKTAVQMVGIPFVMANESWQEIPLPLVGTILIYLAGVLSLWSAILYTYNMIKKLKAKRIHKKDVKRRKAQLKAKLKAPRHESKLPF